MNRYLTITLITLTTLFCIRTAKADIVFPARLELKQVNDSTYDVLFTLPVIQGRVLRATPLLPCLNNHEPKITIDNFAKTMTWRITCPELFGKEVGLEGLGGNQVDILLRIEFLNGRVVQTTLSPVQPTYIVPPPPGSLYIIKTGFTTGIRTFLSRLILLFAVLILFPAASVRNWMAMGLFFLAGIIPGILLHQNNYLVFQENYLYTILLAVSLITVIRRFSDQLPQFTKQWYIPALLVGLACGSGITVSDQLSGLTTTEFVTLIAGIVLGMAAGLTVVIASGYHFTRASEIRRSNGRSRMKWPWFIMGAILTAMLVYDASLYLVLPPPPLMLTTALFLLLAPGLIGIRSRRVALILGTVFLGGVIGTISEFPSVLSIFPVFGIIWYLIIRTFSFKRNTWIDLLVGIIGAFASGWLTAETITNTMSYPAANLVGLFILISMVLTLLYMQTINTLSPAVMRVISAAGSILVLLVYFIQIQDNMGTGIGELSSLGKLPIPAFSLALFVVFLFFIPRRRKIHRQMKVEGQSFGPASAILTLVIVSFPFGWIGINNPWSSGDTMTTSEAQNVLDNKLSNVYTAFNLTDEDELFQRLSENVDQELIDQVYLDSRRRLNAGVREGAQVTVKDIDILEITPKANTGSDQVFEVTWVVTARVKHLQHVHHRRNKYIGEITLRASEDSWKIAHINLTSEDRTVVPVSSL